MDPSWRRRVSTKRTVWRLIAIALGAWLGTELALWTAPDRSPQVETIDYAPRPCR